MSERTALEIADSLEVEMLSLKNAAEMLRSQAAEIERLREALTDDHEDLWEENRMLRRYVGNNMLMSDFRNVDDMRAEIDRLKRERHHIYDLLARIHRDGGQYTAEHGIEKACDDAEAQVVTWLDTISGVDALIEQTRIAEREACAAVCENGSFLHDAAPTAIFGKECARAIRARTKP